MRHRVRCGFGSSSQWWNRVSRSFAPDRAQPTRHTPRGRTDSLPDGLDGTRSSRAWRPGAVLTQRVANDSKRAAMPAIAHNRSHHRQTAGHDHLSSRTDQGGSYPSAVPRSSIARRRTAEERPLRRSADPSRWRQGNAKTYSPQVVPPPAPPPSRRSLLRVGHPWRTHNRRWILDQAQASFSASGPEEHHRRHRRPDPRPPRRPNHSGTDTRLANPPGSRRAKVILHRTTRT